MRIDTRVIMCALCWLSAIHVSAQSIVKTESIVSGVPWFDNKGNIISAHGSCIIKEQGKFYFFGEQHSDTSNAFAGFSCYSSSDLVNWNVEGMALASQSSGKLGPNRVGERVKVMKCPSTGEYVMYMHVDSINYKDQFVGYATSRNVRGPYTFVGPLLFNNKAIAKWDMGSFQDHDGAGYILLHGGTILKLADDYKRVIAEINKTITSGFESPTLFKKGSLYYFLGSHLTSWERNDNYYYTSTALSGPWAYRGLFCPAETLTWNSQTTFVFPIAGTADTTYMFMGDRWSFPKQASAATYVWQPLTIKDTSLSIPAYQPSWRINTSTGQASSYDVERNIIEETATAVKYAGKWYRDSASIISSNESGASFSISFKGSQIGWYGLVRPTGGYAKVIIKNKKDKIVLSSIVDMYCKYPLSTLKFLSPKLIPDNYTLVVTVMGEYSTWSDKRKSDYGSTGKFVSLDRIVIDNSMK